MDSPQVRVLWPFYCLLFATDVIYRARDIIVTAATTLMGKRTPLVPHAGPLWRAYSAEVRVFM
jgi:hypothetical protein